MRRRTLLTGVGGLAASGTLAAGTGAFSTTSASRTVTVATANDDDAVLALRQRGAGGRSVVTGNPDEVAFSFPGAFAPDELGLGTDSVYEFDRDSGRSIFGDPGEPDEKGLLEITNQGTQTVTVSGRDDTESAIAVELYDVTDPTKTALRDDPAVLAPGESVVVGFRLRTDGAETGEFAERLTIVAEGTTD